ncbi:toll-like receptor 8 [Danio aesculapii]|uniref:toll-like receptor 8 n=1 Tax=Danio aesculapii TaxID=1142201 RepID=UPI0024BF2637|nr:toll-like receptor 8 [Danio aesculapii]
MVKNLVIGLILILKLTLALSQLNLRTLKTQPCDIHENVTAETVVVNCRGRRLKMLPQFLTNTTYIDLSENDIRNLTAQSFQGLKNLTLLNLNWLNHNREVVVAKGVFSNLTKLRVLDLSGIKLKYIPKEIPKNLDQLSLVENKITWINSTTFGHVKNLSVLYLSKNCYYWNPCSRSYHIEKGSLSYLVNLKRLTLSFNNLTQVPIGLPVSLERLELGSNSLTYIGEHDFRGLSNLTVLKIQGNCPRCHTAPYPCIPCKNTSIEIHPQAFSDLRNLHILHLAGNSIKSINPAWFANLSKLQELFLSFNLLFNAITDPADTVFLGNLPLLTKLDLSYNFALKTYPLTVVLSPGFANLTSLKTLHLRGLVFREIQKGTFKSLFDLQHLNVLDVGINFIVRATSDIFQHVRLLYLAENRLYPVTVNGELSQATGAGLNHRSIMPLMSEPLHPFDAPKSLVKAECYNTGRVLDLSRNNLFLISPEQFDTYGNISCLNLSRNGFSTAPNGSEFTSLPNLKYLDLSFNKVDLAYDNAFRELQSLEVLDISYNSHYFTVAGVTHNLIFLQYLPSLKVLNMSFNSIYTLTTKVMSSKSLRELQFRGNKLGRMWREKDKTYEKIFKYLTNLTHLDISNNSIGKIPYGVYTRLPVTIQRLQLSHNQLANINWTMLRRFQNLKELILHDNNIIEISSNLSVDVPSLELLNLQRNRISKLAIGFLQGVVNLKELDLSYNYLITVNQSTFPTESYLKTLWLHGNPFHCTCNLLEFVLWILDTNVKIPRLVTGVTCTMPQERKGLAVIKFDIQECIDDQLAFVAYFISAACIICTTFVAITMHLFYWDVSYLYYYLKARFTGYQQLSSESCIYDAFITYDTKDPQVSDWVLNHLRVQLEERNELFLPICLEERDWIPGSPVLDSLTQSIQNSRKTVFVLTEGYVNSGSFKLAVFLAHQRLLEENEDVIVLLLLEPVLQYSHFVRLRRRLCARSILEWPHSSSAEAWFWQSLRNAIRVDNQALYSELYSRYFTTK